jgi:hypothetical protein
LARPPRDVGSASRERNDCANAGVAASGAGEAKASNQLSGGASRSNSSKRIWKNKRRIDDDAIGAVQSVWRTA